MSTSYLSAKKSLGQHFLKNPQVIKKMLEAAKLEKGALVLEIGPGTGILTAALLASGAHVTALEADERAVILLRERFVPQIGDSSLILHHSDIRDVSLTSVIPEKKTYSIVANIPYYLSGMLLRTALESRHQPKCVVFLVQKEVAERVARSKKESLLSLSVKAYGTPRYVATVSRGNFIPPPKVDSAVLAISDISRARFKILDETWFFRLLHAGFASRRKQLLGNLTSHLHTFCTKEEILEHFKELNIPRAVRGEDLSVDTWCALAQLLEKTCSTPQ